MLLKSLLCLVIGLAQATLGTWKPKQAVGNIINGFVSGLGSMHDKSNSAPFSEARLAWLQANDTIYYDNEIDAPPPRHKRHPLKNKHVGPGPARSFLHLSGKLSSKAAGLLDPKRGEQDGDTALLDAGGPWR